MGAAALSGALALGAAGCKEDLAHLCDKYEEGSRPVDGACLSREFADVDAMRKECKGRVLQVEEVLCEEDNEKGPVWECSGLK